MFWNTILVKKIENNNNSRTYIKSCIHTATGSVLSRVYKFEGFLVPKEKARKREKWKRSPIFLQTQSNHTLTLVVTTSSLAFPSILGLPTRAALSDSPMLICLWIASESRGDPFLVPAISRKLILWIERHSMWSLLELESSVWRLQDSCSLDQISQSRSSTRRCLVMVPLELVIWARVSNLDFNNFSVSIVSVSFLICTENEIAV